MSWEQLQSIAAEAVMYAREEMTEPPMACPYDGEPLDPAPDGGLHCPFDGYRWPQQRRII